MFAVLLRRLEAAGKKNIHPFLLVKTDEANLNKVDSIVPPGPYSEAKEALFRSAQTTPRWRVKGRREDRSITRKSLVAPKEDWDELDGNVD